MSDDFVHYLRVRYSECDAQQIVFNARYAEYADIAATEFMRAVWGNYTGVLEQGVDNQVVSLKIDWQASARFDDVLAISVAVEHIGNTSYSLTMKMARSTTNEPLATATIVYVFVEAPDYKKTRIPDDFRQKLEIGAAGQTSNHAGVVA